MRDKSLTYSQIKIGIKEPERALLVHGAHAELMPFVPDAHRT